MVDPTLIVVFTVAKISVAPLIYSFINHPVKMGEVDSLPSGRAQKSIVNFDPGAGKSRE